jgi:hypothetical protein
VGQSAVPLKLVEQVYDELCTPSETDSAHRRSEKNRLTKLLQPPFPAPIEILPGTRAERVMRHLLRRKTSTASSKDRGEAASIAAARADRKLCFVTEDGGAIRLALAELGGSGERVQRLAPFARLLHKAGLLDRGAMMRLASLPVIRDNPPSWWATWLASI